VHGLGFEQGTLCWIGAALAGVTALEAATAAWLWQLQQASGSNWLQCVL
jgi:hypothetical protein